MICEKRSYKADKGYLLNVIWDMQELQRGVRTIDDHESGRIGFRASMYDIEYEYIYTVKEEQGSSSVCIEMGDGGSPTMLHRAFSLLESLMEGTCNYEID